MIVTEHFETRADGVELLRTYSDKGVKIQKVGTEEVYDEAIDVASAGYTYLETDELVEIYSEEDNE